MKNGKNGEKGAGGQIECIQNPVEIFQKFFTFQCTMSDLSTLS